MSSGGDLAIHSCRPESGELHNSVNNHIKYIHLLRQSTFSGSEEWRKQTLKFRSSTGLYDSSCSSEN